MPKLDDLRADYPHLTDAQWQEVSQLASAMYTQSLQEEQLRDAEIQAQQQRGPEAYTAWLAAQTDAHEKRWRDRLAALARGLE